jgi:hypothetical protein
LASSRHRWLLATCNLAHSLSSLSLLITCPLARRLSPRAALLLALPAPAVAPSPPPAASRAPAAALDQPPSRARPLQAVPAHAPPRAAPSLSMSAAAATNSSASNATSPAAATPARHLKMTSSTKAIDPLRKPASPVDGQRRPQAQKAWSQGSANPITQRPSNPTTPNGVANTQKPAHTPASTSGDSAAPMRHLSDRMMYLLANLTVRPTTLLAPYVLTYPPGPARYHHPQEWRKVLRRPFRHLARPQRAALRF